MKMIRLNIVLALLVLIASCKRDNVEVQGELVGVATDGFDITTPFAASTSTINFSGGNTMNFSAGFNQEVKYTITLEGQTTGAKKTITGIGKDMSEDWTGNAELIFFRNETVKATLTVLGREESLGEITFDIAGMYTPEGIQLANFEIGQTTASCWFPTGNQIACDKTYIADPKLERSYAHRVAGKSVEKLGDQFVGLASIDPKSGVNNSWLHFAVPTSDPDELYFNIFIYGTGDDNVAMFIKFMQDDNNNGTHQSDRENGFEMQLLDLSHTGWKKFSFKYSDVPLGGNTSFGGNGDGVHRPTQIRKIELGLWAMKDPSKPVEFIYDYAVFTAGKPFGE